MTSFLKIAHQFFVHEYFLIIPIDVPSFKSIEGHIKELQGVVPTPPWAENDQKSPGRIGLKQSSIDVDKFKAHSVRRAWTSKAVNLGVSINDIISTSDWTNIRTFEEFYHRPLESKDYLPAVLQEEANC